MQRFRLGYVRDPLPGHEKYVGMLAIPYLRRAEDNMWSVISMRFRCIEDHEHKGHGKYMSLSGVPTKLFNTIALLGSESDMFITEGELDAVTATMLGHPAVGVPGSTNWKPHFAEPFMGYERVFILADGDDAGHKFGDLVAGELPNARIIPSPDGEDVNSWITTDEGYEEFRRKIA